MPAKRHTEHNVDMRRASRDRTDASGGKPSHHKMRVDQDMKKEPAAAADEGEPEEGEC